MPKEVAKGLILEAMSPNLVFTPDREVALALQKEFAQLWGGEKGAKSKFLLYYYDENQNNPSLLKNLLSETYQDIDQIKNKFSLSQKTLEEYYEDKMKIKKIEASEKSFFNSIISKFDDSAIFYESQLLLLKCHQAQFINQFIKKILFYHKKSDMVTASEAKLQSSEVILTKEFKPTLTKSNLKQINYFLKKYHSFIIDLNNQIKEFNYYNRQDFFSQDIIKANLPLEEKAVALFNKVYTYGVLFELQKRFKMQSLSIKQYQKAIKQFLQTIQIKQEVPEFKIDHLPEVIVRKNKITTLDEEIREKILYKKYFLAHKKQIRFCYSEYHLLIYDIKELTKKRPEAQSKIQFFLSMDYEKLFTWLEEIADDKNIKLPEIESKDEVVLEQLEQQILCLQRDKVIAEEQFESKVIETKLVLEREWTKQQAQCIFKTLEQQLHAMEIFKYDDVAIARFKKDVDEQKSAIELCLNEKDQQIFFTKLKALASQLTPLGALHKAALLEARSLLAETVTPKKSWFRHFFSNRSQALAFGFVIGAVACFISGVIFSFPLIFAVLLGCGGWMLGGLVFYVVLNKSSCGATTSNKISQPSSTTQYLSLPVRPKPRQPVKYNNPLFSLFSKKIIKGQQEQPNHRASYTKPQKIAPLSTHLTSSHQVSTNRC